MMNNIKFLIYLVPAAILLCSIIYLLDYAVWSVLLAIGMIIVFSGSWWDLVDKNIHIGDKIEV